jgi:hypothetical protein
MTHPPKFAEAAAPWVAGLLLASPVLVAYYPPMTDLAYHEAAIGILRHFSDAAMFPAGLYTRNFGQPNQLFHLLGWALSLVVSTRWAVKLVVGATVLAIPISAARFARHLGASPAAALVVAPMALGWLFSWGLITNLLGLAAFVFLLPPLDRFAQAPTPRRALVVCGGLVLLYFAHEAMMFLYAGVALALAVVHPWSWRKTTWRLVPFAAGVAITVGQAKWQERIMTPAVRSMPRFWHPFLHKLNRIPYIILPVTERPAQFAMLSLCALTLGLFLWLRSRERRAPADPVPRAASRLERLREWALRYRWEICAGLLLVAYFAFPLTLNGATLVYHRWFPPAFAIFAVAAAPSSLWTRAARVPRIALAALPLATLFAVVPSFVDSNREYRSLEPILSAIEPGSAVAALNLGPGDGSRTYSLGPAGGRVLATRGGRLAYAFTDSPASPVVIPRRYQWNESLWRLGFDCWAFRPARDLKRFRYVLLFVTDPEVLRIATFALEPEAEYVTEGGDWALFRSRLPVAPLLSREEPLEKPPPPTLRDRVKGMYDELKSASKLEGLPERAPGQGNGAHAIEGTDPNEEEPY